MKSDQGGYMPVYNSAEIAVLTANGWHLVPEGEWPNPEKKIAKTGVAVLGVARQNKTNPAQLAAQKKRYHDKKRAQQ